MGRVDGMTILFYPPFTNDQHFTDHYYRMVWYLNPLRHRINRIVIPYKGVTPSPGEIPYYLDETIKQIEPNFHDAVDYFDICDERAFESVVKECDLVLLWRVDPTKGDRVPDGPAKDIVKKKKSFRIDHQRERYAGSFYLQVSADLSGDEDEVVKECKEKFSHIPAESFRSTGYIFGTGPSLKAAFDHDFSDGTPIVCNTIVKNKELMHKLQPPIVVIGDPIFHAGCSSYAGEFRQHLHDAMSEFDSYLIVPMRDYRIYMANLDPRLQQRIIGVPMVRGAVPNLDMRKNFYVTTTSNILTLFVIPLACTFFDTTYIMGCDGRPMDEKEYFWKHDPSSQLTERMGEIQTAHPAFFSIDYNDYYLEHCDLLARWLHEGEERGKRFINITPSFIPALQARQISSKPEVVQPQERPTLSIVMPAFNEAKAINQAVESIQTQSVTDWELIVVDDGSSDNTREIVLDLMDRDSRIRLLKNTGKGVSSARNTGLDAARGEFITFLDADDFMYSNALEPRVEAFKRNPNWRLVHCITERVGPDFAKLGLQGGQQSEVTFEDMSGNRLQLNSILGRAEIFKSLRFHTEVTSGEDWLFVSDILRGGVVSHKVDGCAVAYRFHSDSVVCADFLSHENSVVKVLDMIYSPVRDDLPVAPKFAQGLSKPPKRLVVVRRRVALLTWLLLEQRADDVTAVLKELSSQDLSMLSKHDIRRQIKYAAMRFYTSRQVELVEGLNKDKEAILKLVDQSGTEETFPQYVVEFKCLIEKGYTSDMNSAKERLSYHRLVNHLNKHYPTVATIGRFGMSSLRKLKK